MADINTTVYTEFWRYATDSPDKSLRLYNSMPEAATLQIRGVNVNTPMLAMATLNREQLNELRNMIDQILADM